MRPCRQTVTCVLLAHVDGALLTERKRVAARRAAPDPVRHAVFRHALRRAALPAHTNAIVETMSTERGMGLCRSGQQTDLDER